MNEGKIDVLLGLQWGDEGKGKVVDVRTEVRAAQHTVRNFSGRQSEYHRQWSGTRTRFVHGRGQGAGSKRA